ncbi:hypothetical protein [Achromobacter ruhlandii]|uniref:hypothetical protein n=1 Tax=Achromobacter ruhlandii TaxID=72557 RepID=UPI003B9BD0E8
MKKDAHGHPFLLPAFVACFCCLLLLPAFVARFCCPLLLPVFFAGRFCVVR